MRYFRSSPDVYAQLCDTLDAAYGYPNNETKTLRSLPEAVSLPSDSQGRVYLAIAAAYCDYVLPARMLPELLASGAIEEVSEGQYVAILPPDRLLP